MDLHRFPISISLFEIFQSFGIYEQIRLPNYITIQFHLSTTSASSDGTSSLKRNRKAESGSLKVEFKGGISTRWFTRFFNAARAQIFNALRARGSFKYPYSVTRSDLILSSSPALPTTEIGLNQSGSEQ